MLVNREIQPFHIIILYYLINNIVMYLLFLASGFQKQYVDHLKNNIKLKERTFNLSYIICYVNYIEENCYYIIIFI